MEIRRGGLLLLLLCLQVSLWVEIAVAGDQNSWNILNYFGKRKKDVGMSLKNYCESWRLNVELNNIRGFDVVPGECAEFVGKYMGSSQYKADVQRAAEESALFLTDTSVLRGDGKDACVFDVDDTLLSNVPYYKQHNFGSVLGCRGVKTNRSSLEKWMEKRSAPPIEHILHLYNEIKGRGLKIFIISSRKEYLRDATSNNLVKAGYHGWTELILRCAEDGYDGVKKYKAEQRQKLVEQGYRLRGIVGDQWSSLLGHPKPKRTFKLPNPMYYDS